ncbi:hypothetical protein [Porphyromonas loveana]|uniref:hypothetical protein n=1 Tax=Porphyromonas loveana TaxID=1884669 RepID=UPI0035A06385
MRRTLLTLLVAASILPALGQEYWLAIKQSDKLRSTAAMRGDEGCYALFAGGALELYKPSMNEWMSIGTEPMSQNNALHAGADGTLYAYGPGIEWLSYGSWGYIFKEEGEHVMSMAVSASGRYRCWITNKAVYFSDYNMNTPWVKIREIASTNAYVQYNPLSEGEFFIFTYAPQKTTLFKLDCTPTASLTDITGNLADHTFFNSVAFTADGRVYAIVYPLNVMPGSMRRLVYMNFASATPVWTYAETGEASIQEFTADPDGNFYIRIMHAYDPEVGTQWGVPGFYATSDLSSNIATWTLIGKGEEYERFDLQCDGSGFLYGSLHSGSSITLYRSLQPVMTDVTGVVSATVGLPFCIGSGVLSVTDPAGVESVLLYVMAGRELCRTGSDGQLDLKAVPRGHYLVSIVRHSGTTTEKILIR